jgi:hypothetical protein
MYSVLMHEADVADDEACLHVPCQRGERGSNDNQAARRVATQVS